MRSVTVVGAPTAGDLSQVIFRLSDSNGPAYIDFGPHNLYSVIPDLNGKFSEVLQIPLNSAVGSHLDYNYDRKMEILSFLPEFILPPPFVKKPKGAAARNPGRQATGRARRRRH